MNEDHRGLLGRTLPHLRRLNTILLASRSGAASDREQEIVEVRRLIEDIEASVAERTEPTR